MADADFYALEKLQGEYVTRLASGSKRRIGGIRKNYWLSTVVVVGLDSKATTKFRVESLGAVQNFESLPEAHEKFLSLIDLD
ncbi:MAG: hypothetical protein AAGA46_03500 [Cyanobacteria bacterium P01_F01_bin.13]